MFDGNALASLALIVGALIGLAWLKDIPKDEESDEI